MSTTCSSRTCQSFATLSMRTLAYGPKTETLTFHNFSWSVNTQNIPPVPKHLHLPTFHHTNVHNPRVHFTHAHPPEKAADTARYREKRAAKRRAEAAERAAKAPGSGSQSKGKGKSMSSWGTGMRHASPVGAYCKGHNKGA